MFAVDEAPDYRIEYDKDSQKIETFDTPNKKGIYVTVRFRLFLEDGMVPSPNDVIVVEEEGEKVWRQKVTTMLEQPMTAILALDVSASMGFYNKIGEAKSAAGSSWTCSASAPTSV